MLIEANPFKVFAGSKGQALAQRICDYLGCSLGRVNVEHFSDGEFAVSFEDSVRGQSVYLVQSTCPSSDNLMELLLMIDAARRASAYKVVAVIPYFGWARQDRKDKPRVSIGAKLVANMIQTAGADRVITLDLHADQIQGFFDIPVDHLYGSSILADYIQSLNLDNLIIAPPDVGGSKRAANFCKKLERRLKHEVPMVICYKQRLKANQISEMRVLGDVEGKDVVIVDDIADTAHVGFIMCLQAVGPSDNLLIGLVRDAVFHDHDDRLVHLVRNDLADAGLAGSSSFSIHSSLPPQFCFSRSTVFTRAISRRVAEIRVGLSR